jgi:hypothetical protein
MAIPSAINHTKRKEAPAPARKWENAIDPSKSQNHNQQLAQVSFDYLYASLPLPLLAYKSVCMD